MSEENAATESYNDDDYFDSVVESASGEKPSPAVAAPEDESADFEQEAAGEEVPNDAAEQEPVQPAEDWQAKYRELEHRLKSDEGRVSAYQRQIDELNAKIKASPKPEIESLQQLKADYPDIAKAIDDRINEATAAFESRLTPLQRMQEEQAEALRLQQFHESVNALSTQHPDWQQYDRDKNQEFASWLNQQPSGIQAMYGAERDTAANAAALISFYKQSKASKTQDAAASSDSSQRKQDRLQRAVIPQTRSGSVSREPSADLTWNQAVERAQQYFS